MTFTKDLAEWKQIEQEFAKMLIDKWAQSIELAPSEQFKDWDIKTVFICNGKPRDITWEIKDDKISSQTWNIWFEFRCFNKSSWIYASKADYIVYHVDGKYYYQTRGELLSRICSTEKEVRVWGDYNGSEMYVIKKQYLNWLFKERWKT